MMSSNSSEHSNRTVLFVNDTRRDSTFTRAILQNNETNWLKNESNESNNETILFDYEALIKSINAKMAKLLIPATIYASTMMVLGLVGNLMVCYYYGFKTKRTANTFFIIILAIYDIIVCVVFMPTEIADIQLFYTSFDSGVLCKLLRFVNNFAVIGSIFTLISIAVDRFKKICRVSGSQMGIRTAKLVSTGIIGISILWNLPAFVIYGSIQIPVQNSLGIALMGSDCEYTKDAGLKKYVWAFNGANILLFIVSSVVLIVLYSIIGYTLLKHKKKLMMYKQSKINTISSNENGNSMTDWALKVTANAVGNETGIAKPRTSFPAIRKQDSTLFQKQSVSGDAAKITLVMVIVTIVFIVSFLPYLSLSVLRVVRPKHDMESLNDAEKVWFKIGSRSFLLNSSLNPWIYGIFNTSFRQFFFGRMCRKHRNG
jgi:hypothetical protein